MFLQVPPHEAREKGGWQKAESAGEERAGDMMV